MPKKLRFSAKQKKAANFFLAEEASLKMPSWPTAAT